MERLTRPSRRLVNRSRPTAAPDQSFNRPAIRQLGPGLITGAADDDPSGFAVKFYTEEGNWDLVGNNTPVFFLRDPLKFPDLNHAVKCDQRTQKEVDKQANSISSSNGK